VGRDVLGSEIGIADGSGWRDVRVREAHRRACAWLSTRWKGMPGAHRRQRVAQTTRMGGGEVRARQQPSGRWLRAPQLHTHAVIFNVTETAEAKRARCRPGTLQDAAVRDGCLPLGVGGAVAADGYEVERGAHGQRRSRYTREYWRRRVSPQQIVERLEEQGRRGAGAAQIGRTERAMQAGVERG